MTNPLACTQYQRPKTGVLWYNIFRMLEQKQLPIVSHKGIFKKQASTSEAVFMITGLTIGAGVLGLPYVVARSGLSIGLLLIVVWGLVIYFLI